MAQPALNASKEIMEQNSNINVYEFVKDNEMGMEKKNPLGKINLLNIFLSQPTGIISALS